ncbi:MAG: hypothetical protein JWP11_3411 [Frankiales bacterium]|nr:hypothetical protein [Frankiales bacterium]
MRFEWPAYNDEWRGNRLTAFKVYRVLGEEQGSARIIDVCTSDDIVDQIALATPRPMSRLDVPAGLRAEWSHRLYFPDGPGPDARVLFSLLSEVLSIRVQDVDVALALDWYKIPPDEDHDWRNTDIGELRYRAKYYRSSPGLMRAARDDLVDLMADVMSRHPLYAQADAIVTCPGHDASVVSCGEDLARRLADAAGLDLIATQAKTALRPEAKAGGRMDLSDEFSMPTSLSDLTVIVADDALQSGHTMRHVAAAARRAGASRVLGLVPVRTMSG